MVTPSPLPVASFISFYTNYKENNTFFLKMEEPVLFILFKNNQQQKKDEEGHQFMLTLLTLLS